jgi:hypothetical protein
VVKLKACWPFPTSLTFQDKDFPGLPVGTARGSHPYSHKEPS